MQPSTSASPARRSRLQTLFLSALAVVLAGIVLTPLMAPAAVYLAFRPTGDLKAVQRGLTGPGGIALERQLEVAIRPVVFSLLRAGAAVSDAPREARTALSAIRGVEVGLYQATSTTGSREPARLLSELDRSLGARHWDRIVTVVDGREVVAVFGPRDVVSPRDLALAVVVFDGSQAVVASVRGNAEALVTLALEASRNHGIPRLALGR